MTRRKTHEEFVKEVQEKYGNEYEILGEYVNVRTKIKVKHNCEKCNNHKWEITPHNLLKGRGCPKCKGGIKKKNKEFIKEIYNKYGDEYLVLSEYVNARTKIKIRHNCKECQFNEWEITPDSLLKNHGCPVCSGREAKLGINTIWDTDRWMIDLGMSEEDAKKYTRCSNKRITVKCPDCGREKEMIVSKIYNRKSISCPCGDGKSYPEKFIFNLLEQLDVGFETEYKPKWINDKKYDFYIKDLKYIIETHGKQHYNGGFSKLGGRTLKEEQQNDKLKKEMALQNGIQHYIELDCRNSNLEWIKSSILKSELNELFDLSNINWTSCAEFANKNIVKEVCKYWNNKREDETMVDLGKIFNLNRNTIRRYLIKGNKLGWCEYSSKEIITKRVEIFKNSKSLGTFSSCHELERQSEKLFGITLFHTNISAVCNGNMETYKGYQFKYIENVA
ncbi:zinc-ribbon domain-containing protein [Clostridium perfringens]|uniref:zinc-ribbon domain-containing protein n=1 Tax=Clostridium perfringens TaxID=1502 RepID=UPI0024BD55F9|nr:zinc-ribbon domain-containing protein [Clostridium perfringens]CAJ1760549.1 hypothetical protein AUSP0115_00037 [uncultured phage]